MNCISIVVCCSKYCLYQVFIQNGFLRQSRLMDCSSDVAERSCASSKFVLEIVFDNIMFLCEQLALLNSFDNYYEGYASLETGFCSEQFSRKHIINIKSSQVYCFL